MVIINGLFEYNIYNMHIEDLYPITFHFEIEKSFLDINIININSTNNRNNYEFEVKTCYFTDKYQIQ